jgi:hypothetical protein
MPVALDALHFNSSINLRPLSLSQTPIKKCLFCKKDEGALILWKVAVPYSKPISCPAYLRPPRKNYSPLWLATFLFLLQGFFSSTTSFFFYMYNDRPMYTGHILSLCDIRPKPNMGANPVNRYYITGRVELWEYWIAGISYCFSGIWNLPLV